MRILFVFLFTVLSGVQLAKAQDTLRMLNGNIWIVQIGEISNESISFLPLDGKKKSFQTREKENIFSYTKKNQSEVVLYAYNEDLGNIYEVGEMRDFMTGERHASTYYKSRFTYILSVVVGGAAGYAMSEGSGLYAVTPLFFSSIALIPGTKVKRNKENEAYLRNNAYYDGYIRVAKGKKFFSSLKLGVLSMVGTYAALKLAE